MRPILDKEIDIQDFQSYYWLKEELQSFCREHGMSASGSKIELSNRILIFLETGKIETPIRKRASSKTKENEILSLDTVITKCHRCSQKARKFFKQEIGPHFHFSTYIQNYFKENVGKTYRDVVDAWNEEEIRKKDPSYQTVLAPQFEYNQFIRDYFADLQNKGKKREEAIASWNMIKMQKGSRKYTPRNE